MKNKAVEHGLNECFSDLERVKTLVDTLGALSNPVLYLNQYAVIRACGAVEIAFKGIITDHCSKRSKQQVKSFLAKKVRDSSMNPSYDNICGLLSDFDHSWRVNFKATFRAHPDKDKLKTSMESLVDARNDFAHGGSPTLSISNTVEYFLDFRQVIEILDNVVS
jgi:hypothetical protein